MQNQESCTCCHSRAPSTEQRCGTRRFFVLCSLKLHPADASGMLHPSRTQVPDEPAAPPLDLTATASQVSNTGPAPPGHVPLSTAPAAPAARTCSRSKHGCQNSLPPASPHKKCDACRIIHRDEQSAYRDRQRDAVSKTNHAVFCLFSMLVCLHLTRAPLNFCHSFCACANSIPHRLHHLHSRPPTR